MLPVGRPRYARAGAVQHEHRFAGAGLQVAVSIPPASMWRDAGPQWMSSSLVFTSCEDGKAFVGVEDIGGDQFGPGQIQAEFVDRAGQAEPIEHLVLAGVDDVVAGGACQVS